MHPADDALHQQALRHLARAGRRLYSVLFDEPVQGDIEDLHRSRRVGQLLRELSRRQSLRIQINARDFIVPWNILYDGDLSGDTIDERGFWGFRHVIEEIPSGPSRMNVPAGNPRPEAPGMTVGLNLMRDADHVKHVTPQISAARALATVRELTIRQNDGEILAMLTGKERAMAIEYFYCHAQTGGDLQRSYDESFLSLSEGEQGLTLDEIRSETVAPDAMAPGRPLIILNACESAEIDGRFYDGFVPWFLARGASAVIGTDCETPSLFAAHFGTALLAALAQDAPIGDTLLTLRQTFNAEHRNPLGLIYRVFGNIDARSLSPAIPLAPATTTL
jgi:hypothetical protein